MLNRFFFLSLIITVLTACSGIGDRDFSFLESGFKNLPDSTKPGAYWYWINEHVSREGITKDLEAMRRIGIGEAFIGNIYEPYMPKGEYRTLSDEWFDLMRFALTEGERIGVKVSSFNCPGWSQAGGPWVKPEDAMRYLTFSEKIVEGDITEGKHALPRPADFFQDVAVLAVPILVKDNVATEQALPLQFQNQRGVPCEHTFSFPVPVLKRSLVITPYPRTFRMNCEIYADGKLIKTSYFDRASDNLSFGPEPWSPLCISLGEIVAKEFKIVMTRLPANFAVKNIELTAEAMIDHYAEKLNNKMPYTSTPDWFEYWWETQAEPSADAVVQPTQIIYVSEYLRADTLFWNAPAGKWRIMRLGMAPTLKTNKPTAPWSQGLEIDKMSRRALQHHYDSYIGKIVKGLPDSVNFYRVIADSYETGPGNWTDDFREVFQKTYGYDALPWLALFSGQAIGSAEQSDRFMWDLRRLVADRIASEFVGGMAEVCEKNGASLWLENYGWDGFPSEFLKYAALSPAVGGEYWTTSPNVESRLAASACHIYNKNIVYAESYTTGGHLWEFYPRTLKKKGDEAYTEGINQHIMHVIIHQPYEDKKPGVNSWFGIELNRHNTWFEQAGAWIDYQRRCCYLLQQGLPAADVCFFVGEDCPKMAGWKDPALSSDYDYDFINADVILNDMTVKNNRLTLSSGVSYSLLVLPPLTTMRPELLEKIEKLVAAGGKVLGNPVEKSPSLQNYPHCDEKVKEIAKRLWAKNGTVFCDVPINEVLAQIGVSEAVRIDSGIPVLWKQRDLPDGRKIYFISNQSDSTVEFSAAFRTTGYQPELWDAVDGSMKAIEDFSVDGKYSTVNLHLDASGSAFIIFKEKFKKLHPSKNSHPSQIFPLPLWTITFPDFSLRDTTLFDWTTSSDKRIKYFSGTADYTTDFNISDTARNFTLSIENIGVIATVYVNGRETGTIWTKPYLLDISDFVKEGKNELKIRVTNVWRNKLVEKLNGISPCNDIWLLDAPSRESYGDRLEPSGIWGQIKILSNE